MQKLNELFSRACELSERGKKCPTDLAEMVKIRDEFWAMQKRAEAAQESRLMGAYTMEFEPAVSWNGEGLPPVGCECEFFNGQRYYARDSSPEDGQVVKIHAHVVSGAGIACAVFSWIGSDKSVMSEAAQEGLFRPMRTKAELNRLESVDAFCDVLVVPRDCGARENLDKIYDAIAAGKIPHITLK